MAGCDLGGSYTQEFTVNMTVSLEQKTGGNTTLTEYEWEEQTVLPTAEKQTLNGKLVYEDVSYERDETNFKLTCYRKYYEADGTTLAHTHRRELSYRNGWGLNPPYKTEVFLDNDRVELLEYTYDEWGMLKSARHEKDGVLVYEKKDYTYQERSRTYTLVTAGEVEKTVTESFLETQHKNPDRTEIKIGDVLVEYTQHSYNNGYSYAGFEKYTVAGTVETLIEKQDNLKVDGMTATYDITLRDENGENPVVTNVEEEYVAIKVKLVY